MVLMFLLRTGLRFEPGFLVGEECTSVSVEVRTDYHYAMERLIKVILTSINGPWYRTESRA